LDCGRFLLEGSRMEGKPDIGWRAWIVAILAAAVLSVCTTLLLGHVFHAAPTAATTTIGGGFGCPAVGK